MDRFDPTEALLGGLSSTWGRLAGYFLAVFVGHGVGTIAANSVHGFDFDWADVQPFLLAITFLWGVLQNFLYATGIIYTLILASAFCLAAFTDRSLAWICGIMTIVQTWDTFFLHRALSNQGLVYWEDTPPYSNWGLAIAGIYSLVAAALPAVQAVRYRKLLREAGL